MSVDKNQITSAREWVQSWRCGSQSVQTTGEGSDNKDLVLKHITPKLCHGKTAEKREKNTVLVNIW